MRYLPDDNLSYPVLITFDGGSSGSGFYLNNSNINFYFITALHVLFREDDKDGLVLRGRKAKFLSYDVDLAKNEPIILEVDLTIVNVKKDVDNDIVMVEIGDFIEEDTKKIVSFKKGVINISNPAGIIVTVGDGTLKKYDDVLISNEVFLLGYPNSLSFKNESQIDYNRPLLRKGIIAGKNPRRKTIILDCPVYFGNSGGLVIEVEEVASQRKFSIIGVVVQYIPFVETLKSLQMRYENTNIENSGYSVAIPSDTILNLLKN